MIRYIALLRGINISGKNKISMNELKLAFEKQNFYDVFTYINSGNVIFSSEIYEKNIIVKGIRNIIKNTFNLDIPIFIMTIDELKEIFKVIPEWCGKDNDKIYSNIIFIIPPVTYEEIFLEIGDANEKYEKIYNYKNVIFWSFNLKDYSKTNWIKTANSKINNNITIRTVNTMKKILDLDNKRGKK